MEIVINQIEIIDYQPSINAEKIIESIITNQDCNDFIVFPELCITGFPESHNIESLWKESESFFQEILLASKLTKATIIIGHIENYNQSLYNSCFFINNSKIIHVHRKSKLWADDIGVFSSGNSHRVIEINGAVCGAQICFELEFPEGSRTLAKAGAELIFMPNGNMHPFGNVHYVLAQARAIENQCFVVLCNRVGSGHGGNFVGESLIISPCGEILCKLGPYPESVKTTINLNDIKKSKNDYNYINLL